MTLKWPLNLTASTLLLSATAFAGALNPECVGVKVTAQLRGTYFSTNDGEIEISANSLVKGGQPFKAWTCEKNGVLILVRQSGANPAGESFESHAIAISGQLMFDFGEVKAGFIVDAFHPGLQLSNDALQEIMASGLVVTNVRR